MSVALNFRDSTVVIIETGRTTIRAGLGLHDLLKTPTVEIPARVGLRRSDISNGVENQDELRPTASTSRESSLPQQSAPGAKVTDYLVGTQLDDALAAGQDILVSWPFADGDVRDWTQAEALWKHILFNRLGLRRAHNESPVLLSVAPSLSRDTYARISQIFFERFNVAGFSIIDRPTSQLYAANSLNGLVVDIGYDRTDISPIWEGLIVQPAFTSTHLGIRDCQNYLAHLLRSNQSVLSVLSPPTSPLPPDTLNTTLIELATHIWSQGLVRVPSDGETALVPEDEGVTDIAAVLVAGKEKAVIETGMKKKASAKASAAEQARAKEIEALDLITVEFQGKELTLGKERHRFCEPLFDPGLLAGITTTDPANQRTNKQVLSLQDAVGHAVLRTEIDHRQDHWQGLFVTGDLTNHVRGIGTALQSRLASFILSSADQYNEVQPRSIRVLYVPEYFAEYRDKGDGLAAFLGSSIVAKITFSDPAGKNFASKADYIEKGPRAIIEMSASLL